MFELLALLAVAGGVYWFVIRPSMAPKQLPPGKKEADPQLDAKFEAALVAVESDPLTAAILSSMRPEASPAEIKLGVASSAVEMRSVWSAKEPHELSLLAAETRFLGPTAVSKKLEGSDAYALKTRTLSDIVRTKIDELTGQGKNLDAAFKEIDEGKMPISEAAMIDGAMIDKAALAPVIFVKTSAGLSKEGAMNMFGNFVLPGGQIVGTGNVEEGRMIGVVKGQMLGVGKVVDFAVDPPPPAGTYFGKGTHVYTSVAVTSA